MYRKRLAWIELFSYVKNYLVRRNLFLGNSPPTLPLGKNVGLVEGWKGSFPET